jgi:hypothetical protein
MILLRLAGYSPSGRAVRASLPSLDHGGPEARLRSGVAALSCFASGPARTPVRAFAGVRLTLPDLERSRSSIRCDILSQAFDLNSPGPDGEDLDAKRDRSALPCLGVEARLQFLFEPIEFHGPVVLVGALAVFGELGAL